MSSTYGSRSRTKRPLGITILCIVGGIGVLLGLVGSLGLLATGGAGAILGLFALAITVGQVAVLYGLWTLQQWGYKWALVFYGLSAVLNLVSLSILSLIIDILIVVYLTSKADHFR